jgi:hypothetical protein
VVRHSIGIDLNINGAHDCTILDASGQVTQRFTFDSSSAGLLKLEQRIRTLDPSHGAPTVVMEPTGLAWLLPCLYLRAQLPNVKVVRIKTSKVAALRRYLTQDTKSDRLDSLTLAKMPLVDPEKLYAVDLPPAALQRLDRMTRQRARLVENLTARKNRLQAVVGGYLPGLMAVTGKPWGPMFRAVLTVSLNPVTLATQDESVLQKTMQDKPSRKAPPEELIPRLRGACSTRGSLKPTIHSGAAGCVSGASGQLCPSPVNRTREARRSRAAHPAGRRKSTEGAANILGGPGRTDRGDRGRDGTWPTRGYDRAR